MWGEWGSKLPLPIHYSPLTLLLKAHKPATWGYFFQTHQNHLCLLRICCSPCLKFFFLSSAQLTLTYPACLSSRAIFSEDFPLSQLAEFSPYSMQLHLLCILSLSKIALGIICLATVPGWGYELHGDRQGLSHALVFPSLSRCRAHIPSTDIEVTEYQVWFTLKKGVTFLLSGNYIKHN